MQDRGDGSVSNDQAAVGRSPWETTAITPGSVDESPAQTGLALTAETAHDSGSADAVHTVRKEPAAGVVHWISVSGGAGSSSLAHASGVGIAGTGQWPSIGAARLVPVVLVARSDMAGLNAAGQFLREWDTNAAQCEHIDLLGLVISSDAPGRPPRAVRARVAELHSVVTVWHLPWIAAWRETPRCADPAVTKLVATVAASTDQEDHS